MFSLFSHVQDETWNEVMETHQKLPTDQLDLRKQQEAMWELFTSECTYFLDHLLVLKMVMLAFSLQQMENINLILWTLVFSHCAGRKKKEKEEEKKGKKEVEERAPSFRGFLKITLTFFIYLLLSCLLVLF